VGAAFVFHGYPKMQHPTTWMTLSMGSHAFAPPWLQAVVAGVEFFGGFALILGFATSLAATLIFCDMFVALFFCRDSERRAVRRWPEVVRAAGALPGDDVRVLATWARRFRS
jgi:uncharacterized membrane protein YphA (DoxX/SURF4 family)